MNWAIFPMVRVLLFSYSESGLSFGKVFLYLTKERERLNTKLLDSQSSPVQIVRVPHSISEAAKLPTTSSPRLLYASRRRPTLDRTPPPSPSAMDVSMQRTPDSSMDVSMELEHSAPPSPVKKADQSLYSLFMTSTPPPPKAVDRLGNAEADRSMEDLHAENVISFNAMDLDDLPPPLAPSKSRSKPKERTDKPSPLPPAGVVQRDFAAPLALVPRPVAQSQPPPKPPSAAPTRVLKRGEAIELKNTVDDYIDDCSRLSKQMFRKISSEVPGPLRPSSAPPEPTASTSTSNSTGISISIKSRGKEPAGVSGASMNAPPVVPPTTAPLASTSQTSKPLFIFPRISYTGKSFKMFVGNIAIGIEDTWLAKILMVSRTVSRCRVMVIVQYSQSVGRLLTYKRVRDAAGNPMDFAFVEYADPESALRCLDFINGTPLRSQDGPAKHLLVSSM